MPDNVLWTILVAVLGFGGTVYGLLQTGKLRIGSQEDRVHAEKDTRIADLKLENTRLLTKVDELTITIDNLTTPLKQMLDIVQSLIPPKGQGKGSGGSRVE